MKYVDRDGRKEENEGDESEYVKVYYLYDEDGANGAGHIALLLEKEDGTGEIYSYSTSWEGLDAVKNGLGFDNNKGGMEQIVLDRFEYGQGTSVYNVETFLKSEVKMKIGTNETSRYFEGQIYRWITDEQGEELNECLLNYDPIYNLYNNNCGQIAWQALKQAGIKFLDIEETIPKDAYRLAEEFAMEDKNWIAEDEKE